MKFVAIPAGALQAIDPAVLNPKENTLDEVILKNYEAHKDGSPQTVLNVSEAVADRLRELQPKAVSTETVAPVVPTESDSQTASSSDVLDPPSGEAKTGRETEDGQEVRQRH